MICKFCNQNSNNWWIFFARVGIISEWYSLLPANYILSASNSKHLFHIFKKKYLWSTYVISVTFFSARYIIIFRPYVEMNLEKLKRLHSIDFSMRISKMHGLPKKFRNPFWVIDHPKKSKEKTNFNRLHHPKILTHISTKRAKNSYIVLSSTW